MFHSFPISSCDFPIKTSIFQPCLRTPEGTRPSTRAPNRPRLTHGALRRLWRPRLAGQFNIRTWGKMATARRGVHFRAWLIHNIVDWFVTGLSISIYDYIPKLSEFHGLYIGYNCYNCLAQLELVTAFMVYLGNG